MIGFAFLCMFGSLAQVPEPSISNIMPAKYVADAAEQLTGHRAHMTKEIRLQAGTRLASPAVTLRIVRDETCILRQANEEKTLRCSARRGARPLTFKSSRPAAPSACAMLRRDHAKAVGSQLTYHGVGG